ncbi:hypothetical protein NHX12_008578 [Muraenolepis orangiensis]|uniref:Uncharacterized protein n=1 Tax=Muraenolepis orangiensis TaxID=630683 RepID=A0A9Q0DNB8_9TELE|nr:hypothetical protein NHX12_008578 [Muraenolepis orangiensis]
MNWPQWTQPKTLHTALSAQGVNIYQHQQQLGSISQRVKDLAGRQADLQDSVTSQIQQLTAHMHQFFIHLQIAQTAPPSADFTDFTDTMSRIFDHTSPATEASRRLLQMHHHNR